MCMTELGQLEAQHEEFAKRNVRVMAVTLEGREDAEATQKRFPHLIIVSDPEQKLAGAVHAIHHGANPHGGDAATPTTLLLDRDGIVRWAFRPDRFIVRLSPESLLTAVDQNLPSR